MIADIHNSKFSISGLLYTALLAAISMAVLDMRTLPPTQWGSSIALIVLLAVFAAFVIGIAESLIFGLMKLLRRVINIKRYPLLLTSLLLTIVMTPWIYYITTELFSGAGMSRSHYARWGPWITFPALFCLVLLGWAALFSRLRFHRRCNTRVRMRIGETVLVFILAGALHHFDLVLFPRLYGYLHIVLTMSAFVLLQYGWTVLQLTRNHMSWTITIPILGVLSLPVFLKTVDKFPEARQMVVNNTAAAAKLISLGSRFEIGRSAESEETPLTFQSLCKISNSIFTGMKTRANQPSGILQDYNVLFIVVDALRADHVGAYGYPLSTSPAIDRLMKMSAQFEHTTAQGNKTALSVQSFYWSCNCNRSSRVMKSQPNLLQMFRQNGYFTFTAVPSVVYSFVPQITAGSDVNGFQGSDPQKRTKSVLEIIDNHRDRRFAAWLQYYSVHIPYDAPEQYRYFGEKRIDYYDSAVRTDDHGLELLLNGLAERDLLNKTIVVLTADHGEAFMEHGVIFHGTSLHEEQVRVPLSIYAKGIQPAIYRYHAALIDLYPTFIDLTGISSEFDLEGLSLAPLLLKGIDPGSRVIHSASTNPEQKAVILWPWKFIEDFDNGTIELYNLANDPGEIVNLAYKRPDIRKLCSERMRFHNFSSILKAVQTNVIKEEWIRLSRDILKDRNAGIGCRAVSVKLLGIEGNPKDIPLILNIIKTDESAVVRKEAIRTIFSNAGKTQALHISESQYWDQLQKSHCVETIFVLARNDPDITVRIEAWRAYGLLTSKITGCADLKPFLEEDMDAAEKLEILKALRFQRDFDNDMLDTFTRLVVEESDPIIRKFAFNEMSLRNFNLPPAILNDIITNDPAGDVRFSAVCAVGHVQSPEVTEILAASLSDNSSDVRRAAAYYLGKRLDTQGLDKLEAAIEIEEDPILELFMKDAATILKSVEIVGKPLIVELYTPDIELSAGWSDVKSDFGLICYRNIIKYRADVDFYSDRTGPAVLVFSLKQIGPKGIGHRISVRINGEPVGVITGESYWRQQYCAVPNDIINEGINNIEFIHPEDSFRTSDDNIITSSFIGYIMVFFI